MVNPNTAADQTAYSTPNAKNAIEVKPEDLPVHCPMPGTSLYQLTENGLAAQVTLQGTKFWKDEDLN